MMKNIFCFVAIVFCCGQIYAQDTTRLSLLFLGDIMQHDSQIADAYHPLTRKYDYTPCFQFVKRYTQSADLAIGNLELTLAGPPYKGYPQFSAPDELLVALKDMGMDVLVTANNHCVDTGKKGLERTIQMLDSLKIPHTGTFVDDVEKLNNHPLIIRKNDFKLALLNYTYGTNGLPIFEPNIVNRIDTAAIRADIKNAKKHRPDAIIAFMHWGSEYQSLPSAWQKTVTEFCFKHGVQLVIGAHPHVLQPMEWRKSKNQLVAYSLGNFVSGQRKRYTDGGGLITVGLQKISFANDSAITTIDTANYVLEWVYRSLKGKDYFVLPVPAFENDTAQFIQDQESREAFKLFVADSRILFDKYNLNITEARHIPSDTVSTYRVLFLSLPKDSANVKKSWIIRTPMPYDAVVESSEHTVDFFSGDFSNRNEAEKYCGRLKQDGYTDARLVTFINGRKKE